MVKRISSLTVFLLTVLFAGPIGAAMATGYGQEAGRGMAMHHQHIIAN